MTLPSPLRRMHIVLDDSGGELAGLMIPHLDGGTDQLTIFTDVVTPAQRATVTAWGEQQRQARPGAVAFLYTADLQARHPE
jgi:hypothetical protein